MTSFKALPTILLEKPEKYYTRRILTRYFQPSADLFQEKLDFLVVEIFGMSIHFFKSVAHNLQLTQNKVHTSADVSMGYLERFGKSTLF